VADAARSSPDGFSVVAIIAAHNEADIIGQVVGDLIAQGVQVYLLDHASTDGTADAVAPYLGRGLLRVERYPGGDAPEDAAGFVWEKLLRRKEALARDLPAAWFIHHDADELRESPWRGQTLLEAIRRVDGLGYNAIDFELLNFWPVDDRFRPGDDVRAVFRLYEPGQPWDRVQVRCWKKTDGPLDLASSGGHEAIFPDRRIFPIRFILRHYPIRSQAQGRRKIQHERRARIVQAERDRGWHIQYDAMRDGESLLRDPATLAPYDADAIRLQLALRHRGVEELEGALADQRAALERTKRDLAAEIASLGARLAEAHHRMDELLASRSWRWTAPLRKALRLVAGR